MYIFLFAALYFQVFLLITFLENKEITRRNISRPRMRRYPSVTIMVPCWNEEKTLAKTVRSLLRLNYPKSKLRILIIDDGSTDGTLAIAQRFQKHPQVTVLTKQNGGKHTALNLGLEHTTSELVGCLDADSYVEPDALLHIVEMFRDETIHAVTPAITIHRPSTWIQHIQKAEYDMGIFLRKMFGLLRALQVTPGPFSIFRRSVFDVVGPYKHAHNTEDMEMALRMHVHGLRIENAHTARVYTTGPDTWRKLYRQRIRWTYGFIMNIFEYRSLLFSKQHGHLGNLVLPGALVSITSALYFTFLLLSNTIDWLLRKILEMRIIGIQYSWTPERFDWFFLNTEMGLFIAGSLFITSVTILFLGKKLSEGSVKPSLDLLYYVLFYGFLAPLWLAKAVYNVAFSRHTRWR